MRFYKFINSLYYRNKIKDNNLTAIYTDYNSVTFYVNGKFNNFKNAAYVTNYGSKQFCLNHISYGYNNFTKQSWRKFVKLKAFL